MGVTLRDVLFRHGLLECRPLRTFLDAVCQITVQCAVGEVEAPFALAAMDYYFRGTGHVHGGIGELAWALARAAESRGATLRFTDRVDAIEREGDGWLLRTRKGEVRAQRVVANLTPHALRRVRGESNPRLDGLADAVETGWGAAMLYLRLAPGSLPHRPEAHHLELVADERAELVEGNHLFCSVSALDEERSEQSGERTVTISTHVPMARLRATDPGPYVASIQDRMRLTLAALAPELSQAAVHSMPGSPRTFERFTGRDFGYVGGVPRRAGLHNYRSLTNPPLWPGLWMVGDSVFPGQSTLATALGGVKAAEAVQAEARRTGPRSARTGEGPKGS